MKEAFKIWALFIILGLSSNSWARELLAGPHCTIKTWTGNYVTAIYGGGVPHGGSLSTSATRMGRHEIFKCITNGEDQNGNLIISFQTSLGYYLTAVSGGGHTTNVIHTDAKWIRAWEKFRLISSPDGSWEAIQTNSGHYLTALGGGGRYPTAYYPDVMNSNRTRIDNWEKFKVELLPY